MIMMACLTMVSDLVRLSSQGPEDRQALPRAQDGEYTNALLMHLVWGGARLISLYGNCVPFSWKNIRFSQHVEHDMPVQFFLKLLAVD
jgi:hypothetical protein